MVADNLTVVLTELFFLFVSLAAHFAAFYFRFPWSSLSSSACSALSAGQLVTTETSVCSSSCTSAGMLGLLQVQYLK